MVALRAIETSDLDYIHALENNPDHWHFGDTNQPLAKQTVLRWIEQGNDVYESKRLRLIVSAGQQPVGCLDLYDLDFYHQRGYVAVIIEAAYREKGMAKSCLEWLFKYAPNQLGINNLMAEVAADNAPSKALFAAAGFIHVGTMAHWQRVDAKRWGDILLFQKQL